MIKRHILRLVVVSFLCMLTVVLNAETEVREGYIDTLGGRTWYKIVGSGDAVPLIVLHGGPAFTHDYLEPLEALANERPVIFYDQGGCGNSDPLAPQFWTVEYFVYELHQLRTQLNLEKVHILGHSWGTMLGVDYFLTHPEGIVSMVIASPCLSTQRWLDDQAAYLETLPEDIREIIYLHEAAGTYSDPEYQEAMMEYYRRFLCRLDPWPDALNRSFAKMNPDIYGTMWGPSEFTCTGTLRNYDRTPDLHLIQVPTLFTCGKYDEAAPETVRYYQSLVPHSKLKFFCKSSHTAMLEEPHKYIKEVRQFLNKVDHRFKNKN